MMLVIITITQCTEPSPSLSLWSMRAFSFLTHTYFLKYFVLNSQSWESISAFSYCRFRVCGSKLYWTCLLLTHILIIYIKCVFTQGSPVITQNAKLRGSMISSPMKALSLQQKCMSIRFIFYTETQWHRKEDESCYSESIEASNEERKPGNFCEVCHSKGFSRLSHSHREIPQVENDTLDKEKSSVPQPVLVDINA